MAGKGLLSISKLADFARISRTALIHYDHIGLVSPVSRGLNNYRYYSHRQITSTNLINTMQSLGVSLKEISELMSRRTPDSMRELLSRQSDLIDKEMERLERSQKLARVLRSMLEMGFPADESVIEIREEREESVFMGQHIDYSKGKSVEEATLDFYRYVSRVNPDMDVNYPVWGIFGEERIKRGDWRWPDRFFFWMPDASDAPDCKPKGLYAVGYTRGFYGQTDALYKRLMKHIKESGCEICGPSWEMYPINEISETKTGNYLIKISIAVSKTR